MNTSLVFLKHWLIYYGRYYQAKNWAGELISGQTRAGKILVSCCKTSVSKYQKLNLNILARIEIFPEIVHRICLYFQQVFCVFILSVVSLLVYFRDASAEGVEHCIPYYKNTSQQVDLAFNVGFMVYFLIRVRWCCTFVQIF